MCSKFVSPCPQPGAYAIDVFSQNLTLLSPGWVFPPFKHIPQLVNKVLESPGVKVLMALPYRPREVWWNLLMKHVKFAMNTSEFRLQMPDGTETQPRFVLTLAYVCVNTINCEELPTKRRRLSSMKSRRGSEPASPPFSERCYRSEVIEERTGGPQWAPTPPPMSQGHMEAPHTS